MLTLKLLAAGCRRLTAIDVEEAMLREVKSRAEALNLVRWRDRVSGRDYRRVEEGESSSANMPGESFLGSGHLVEDVFGRFGLSNGLVPASAFAASRGGQHNSYSIEENDALARDLNDFRRSRLSTAEAYDPSADPSLYPLKLNKKAPEQRSFFEAANLHLIHGDVLASDQLPEFDVCVANMP